ADHHCTEGAHVELPLSADIEHTASKTQRDCQASQDIRRSRHARLAQGLPRPTHAGEQSTVGPQHTGTTGPDEACPEEQSHTHRYEGCDAGCPMLLVHKKPSFMLVCPGA